MRAHEELLSRLPSPALQPPVASTPAQDEAAARAIVRQLDEAEAVVSEWLADPATREELPMTRQLRLFVQALVAHSRYVEGMVEAGAGVGNEPGHLVLSDLGAARRRLLALDAHLAIATSRPRSGGLTAIRGAIGVLMGAPANAMDDERALYDG